MICKNCGTEDLYPTENCFMCNSKYEVTTDTFSEKISTEKPIIHNEEELQPILNPFVYKIIVEEDERQIDTVKDTEDPVVNLQKEVFEFDFKSILLILSLLLNIMFAIVLTFIIIKF